MEIRELLTSYEFDGDNIPFVSGSALKALEGDTSEIGSPSIEKIVSERNEKFLNITQN